MSETVFVRLRLVLLALAVMAGLVVVQLLRIDFGGDGPYLRDLGNTLSRYQREFAADRGRIYDRNGELMATNDVEYELGLSPAYVVKATDVATTLSGILDRSFPDLLAAAESDKPYVLIARPVSASVGETIKTLEAEDNGLNLSGIDLTPIPHRFYPGGPLASQVLGYVGYDDNHERVGLFGVEGFYNDLLSGRPVQAVENVVPFDAQPDPAPQQGADLYLTLDRDIQYLVEVAMADAIARYGTVGGTIIVMNPKNGEILGMSSWPTFDPNNYVEYPPGNPANPAISGQYEPGSTFKILTLAAALDAGTVVPQTPFVDTGYIEVGGVPIRNWDGGAWGPVDMTGCLQHSLNVCLAWVATAMGPNAFYNYMAAFGLGHLTNVDMAAEVGGRLKRPGDSDWFESELGTNAFGQGVAVTPLQLVTAISAVANGGTMMQPHILQRVQNGPSVHTTQPQVLGRPIKPETAAALSEMLAQSLERGEGSQALVPGYRIAGKTGTAQIPLLGSYDPNQTIASFVGWGPVDDPQFIVLVKLDRSRTSIWGAETAAPVFGAMAKRLVVLMEIPPDDVRHSLTGQ